MFVRLTAIVGSLDAAGLEACKVGNKVGEGTSLDVFLCVSEIFEDESESRSD